MLNVRLRSLFVMTFITSMPLLCEQSRTKLVLHATTRHFNFGSVVLTQCLIWPLTLAFGGSCCLNSTNAIQNNSCAAGNHNAFCGQCCGQCCPSSMNTVQKHDLCCRQSQVSQKGRLLTLICQNCTTVYTTALCFGQNGCQYHSAKGCHQ